MMTTVCKKRESHVLLVGVGEFVDKFLCYELSRHHCRTHMAVSKEEALKSCEKESPSVIVVKLSANDQNCFSTIAALRAKAAKGVPIIVLSPSTDRTVTDHAVRMGATYCVPTQYDLEPLKEFLLGLLSLQNEPVDCICESGFNSTDYAYENDMATQSAIRN